MNNLAIVYWSGTGNTETMANCIAEGAKEAGAKEVWHCATKREAAERLRAYCRSGDTVLFKASRGMAFEEILQEYRGEQA